MYQQGYRPPQYPQQGSRNAQGAQYPQQGAPYPRQDVQYPQQGVQYPQYPQQGAQNPYGQQGNWYAPPPQQPAKGGKRRASGGDGGTPKQPKKRSLKWQFIKVALLLAVVAGLAAGAYVWKTHNEVRPYADVFAPNVSVDGIDLSGKTWEEGSALVWAQVNQKQSGWYVRLRNAAGDYKDITAETLGISFDPTAALESAWAVAHDVDPDRRKSIFELKDEIDAAKATTNAFFSAEQSADTTPIDTILSTLERAAYRAPSDAYLVTFNPDDAQNPFTYQYETYGQYLDTSAVRRRILEMVQNLESGEILLEVQPIRPTVTVEDLKKTVELRATALTPISSDSSEDRTQNIRIAFAKINGLILEDGKKFSFNTTVGRRSQENGFLPAIEYVYGNEEWGWGGGVCQASTTVYLAAAQSGMTILKREPHSMAVSYTDLGLDATVSDTRGREIDFTFRNESGGNIYIAAHVVQSPTNKRKLMCEVRIYGPSMQGVSYKLESVTTQVIQRPEPVTKEDEEGSYVTYIDQTKTIKGREGYVVESYLVGYQNGQEMGRKLLFTDTYPAKADTIYVGVTPRGGGV